MTSNRRVSKSANGRFRARKARRSPSTAVEVVNFCANNYLGLANHPDIVEAAHEGLRTVRLRIVERSLHLRHSGDSPRTGKAIAKHSSARTTRLPTPLLRRQRRTLRDGARRRRRRSSATNSITPASSTASASAKLSGSATSTPIWRTLERCLKETQNCRLRLIATDSVFSMDGDLAPLSQICDLADKYDAAVMIDESHGTGHLGPHGRGSGRASRRARSHRHHHQHARQDARRGSRRLHDRQPRSRRSIAATLPAVSVLERR